MSFELIDLCAREQRRVDLEVGILGCCTDQGQQAVLDAGEQRILLRLVEAVDLVEEEDRATTAAAEAFPCLRENLPDVRDRCGDRGQLLELGARIL